MPGLYDLFTADGAERDAFRTATVTAISPSLTVQFGGSSGQTVAAVARLGAYVPVVNDTVICLVSKGRVIVMDSLQTAAPLAGAWTSYTPTVAGFTTVTTSVSGAYWQFGKAVKWRAQVTLSTVVTLGSSQITVSLPVTASSSIPSGASAGLLGAVRYRTNASNIFYGEVFLQTTTTAGIRVPATTTVSNLSTWTGAVPAGQVVGDVWTISGEYEAA